MEGIVCGCDHYTVFTKVNITTLTLQVEKLAGRTESELPELINRTRYQREEFACSIKVMVIMFMMLPPSFYKWILHVLLLLLLFRKTMMHLLTASFTFMAAVIVPFCSICVFKSRPGCEEESQDC